MISTSKSINPMRYSLPLVFILSLCLLAAEHSSPKQIHLLDVDFLVTAQAGQLQRQVAYLLIGAFGVVGITRGFQAVGKSCVRSPLVQWTLVLLLSWSSVSLLWSDAPGTTVKRLIVLSLTYVGACGLTLSWRGDQVVRFVAISSALQVLAGFLGELYYGYFSPVSAGYRFAGTMPPNSQGYLCLVLILAALCTSATAGSLRWLYLTLAGYGLCFLLLTRSRGPLASLGLVLFLYLLVVLNIWGKIVGLFLLALVFLTLYMSGTTSKVVSVLDRGGEGNENFTGRGPLWEELSIYTQKRPLTGYGYEAFWNPHRIQDISDDQGWAIGSAHSGYIEGELELGLVGAALHTLLLLLGLAEGIRLYRRTRDTTFFLGASLCLIYLTSGGLESLMIIKTSQTSFYFALLICWAVFGLKDAKSLLPDHQWTIETVIFDENSYAI